MRLRITERRHKMIACVFFAICGLLLGSFLNVCIVRLPAGESVVQPRSHCRQCNQPIANRDNIPVLSWLLLRAKCRACGEPISWRYPAVELATCVFFVMCCLKFSSTWQAGCWALLCFLLLGLAVMDAETLLLPDWFTQPGLMAGVAFSALRPTLEGGDWAWQTGLRAAGRSLLDAGLAAAALLLIAGVYWLARRRMGMGMGDVKLLAMLAAWLGLQQAALVLFLAVIVGALYGVKLILRHPREGSAGQLAVPFGTMLSLAGLYSIFLGERTLGWYLQFLH
jgi:leader peptidase (prepilin peptidase) / N-methyltransferase